MNKLLIIGAGSVGKFIAYNISNFSDDFEILGFLDDDISKHNTIISGYPVLGSIESIKDFSLLEVQLVIGIAFPLVKKNILEQLKFKKFSFPSLVSKNAWISNKVTIGEGTIIYPGVTINYETKIDDFVIINMNCSIGHNCKIGSFTSLSPGVNLGGNTNIESEVEMGIGSSTLQNIFICEGSKIGGQAMVINDVVQPSIMVGIPAKSIIS
jgi:sugar O-acyltransferase (sialic acid O-acetyltransferase NeuD family)